MKNILRLVLVAWGMGIGYGSLDAFARQEARGEDAYRKLLVTVTDSMGRAVQGLGAEDFDVFLQDKRVEIKSIRRNQDPASILFLLDDTASMQVDPGQGDIWSHWAGNLQRFARMGHPDNEYAIVTLRNGLATVLDWTKPGANGLAEGMNRYQRAAKNKSRDAVVDFLPDAIAFTGRATHPKRAIVVVTDEIGPDASRPKFTQAKDLLRTEAVQLHCLCVGSARVSDPGTSILGRRVTSDAQENSRLRELIRRSGGLTIMPTTIPQTTLSFELVALTLWNQYTLVIEKPAPLAGEPARSVRVQLSRATEAKALSTGAKLRVHHQAEYAW